ncbi:MAG: UbiA family prenyltransferase [Methanothrix sp.]|nr:UbiA family prenyltransferase [Methanothrix sp.]
MVGITGFFQTYAGYLLLGLQPDTQICSAVFLMTFSLYSLNKLTDMDEDAINMPERLELLRDHKRLAIAYSATAYMLCILLTFLDSPSSVPLVFLPLVASLLYGSRVLPWLPRLKDIPLIKNITVALSWAVTTTLLPAGDTMVEMTQVVVVFYFMLVKAFVNTALYDVRDVKGDEANNIKTLAVLLGARRTVLLLLFINVTLLPLLTYWQGGARILAGMLTINGLACVLYFGANRRPLLMDLLVDGEWTLACLSIMLLTAAGAVV